MEKTPRISPEVWERISKIAQEKAGADPEKIKKATADGTLEQLMGKLTPEQSKKLMELLSNREAAEALLSTPQARQIVKKLFDKK